MGSKKLKGRMSRKQKKALQDILRLALEADLIELESVRAYFRRPALDEQDLMDETLESTADQSSADQ